MTSRRSVSKTANPGLVGILKAFFLGVLFALLLLSLVALARTVLPATVDCLSGVGVRSASFVARLWHGLWAWTGTLRHSQQLVREQAKLQERLATLQAENVRLRHLAEENRRLRALLGLGQRLGQPFLSAEVIAVGGSHWFRTVVLNRGAEEGVTLYAPVLNHQGLIGRIFQVHRHHSIVLLLTDRRSAVGVALEGHPKVFGVVKGTGGQYLQLLHLSRRILPRRGERLLTSGLGGIFPSGIPVGTIAHIDPHTEPPTITVRPFADDRQLHEVIVLKMPTRQDEGAMALLMPAIPRAPRR
ncbi:MAG: hypothetical protein SLRJCFUN_000479 [Candidatus Fervidibacter sp.]